eukprot:CAMPEP_0197461698 /NCGR_PEP_ID=MMETSP1175-20131217/57213_1 /TAXON_ID=1003142 /ORGANISM="Triceratium dubium, Strain CCMP147" /LENGTH=31 /DNA_ID= /DNA_START= /DNA_END= /DNA_ORIENTATION=
MAMGTDAALGLEWIARPVVLASRDEMRDATL